MIVPPKHTRNLSGDKLDKAIAVALFGYDIHSDGVDSDKLQPYSTNPAHANMVMEWMKPKCLEVQVIFNAEVKGKDKYWVVGTTRSKQYLTTEWTDSASWMEAICHAALAVVTNQPLRRRDGRKK